MEADDPPASDSKVTLPLYLVMDDSNRLSGKNGHGQLLMKVKETFD